MGGSSKILWLRVVELLGSLHQSVYDPFTLLINSALMSASEQCEGGMSGEMRGEGGGSVCLGSKGTEGGRVREKNAC